MGLSGDVLSYHDLFLSYVPVKHPASNQSGGSSVIMKFPSTSFDFYSIGLESNRAAGAKTKQVPGRTVSDSGGSLVLSYLLRISSETHYSGANGLGVFVQICPHCAFS